jgi:hypothetical protein
MTSPRFNRPPKFERFTSPDASAVETVMHYTVAPFDEAVRAMDLKWGQDRLPGLVAPEMAQRYGKAVAALNDAIRANDPEATRQNAVNCAKGLSAMDQAATAAGQAVADPAVWQMEVDGFQFAIIRDARMWPALKKSQPDLVVFTDREIANAVKAYALDTVKDAFPQSTVTAITPRKRTELEEMVDDEIPY